MMSILPPHLTSDAIPERRTSEEPHAPTAGQAQEFLRRLENEEEKNPATQGESEGKNTTKSTPEPSKKTTEPDEASREKKPSSKSKARKTSSSPKVINNTVNISGNNINYGIVTTYNVMGFPNNCSPFPGASFQSGSQPKTQRNDQPPVPEKLLNCWDVVTEDDSTVMSEYVKSDWKDLGKVLFFNQLSLLDDYIEEVEGMKSNREAVRWILQKWREVAGKSAKVARLATALNQLNESKALEKLSKRHKCT